LLVCRYLGWQAEAARSYFLRAWEVIRPAALGRPACPPRIWNL
jgi:urease accessory protein